MEIIKKAVHKSEGFSTRPYPDAKTTSVGHDINLEYYLPELIQAWNNKYQDKSKQKTPD